MSHKFLGFNLGTATTKFSQIRSMRNKKHYNPIVLNTVTQAEVFGTFVESTNSLGSDAKYIYAQASYAPWEWLW